MAFGLMAGLLEGVYRFQLVDTYRQELRTANGALPHLPPKADVLVLGDSFSAGSNAYPALLSQQLAPSGWTVVNAAVSGSTARDALMISPRRVQRFKPSVAVYQIYLGNDLLETKPPFANAGSLARQLYWRAQHSGWRSLGWLNYRLRGFSPDARKAKRSGPPSNKGFNPSAYQARERRWIKTYPAYLTNQLQLLDPPAWSKYERDLTQLIRSLRETAETVVLLVIPHCTQVAPIYRSRFEALGLPASHQPPLGGGGPWPRALLALAKQHPQVVLIDALPALTAEEARGNATYLQNDPHLNHHGQTVLADLLLPVLSKRLDSR